MTTKTPIKRQNGSGARGFVLFLAVIVVLFMLPGLLRSCAQQAPRLVGDVASAVTRDLGHAIGNGASQLGADLTRPVTDKVGELGADIKGLWQATDDADKIKIFCQALPVDGVDKLCGQFSDAVGAAGDMQRERIACLWQAANQSGRGLQIQNNCAAYRNDPSGLESCLLKQADDPGSVAQCLATAPGQFWRSRGLLKPFCPGNVQGIVCGDDKQASPPVSDYEYNANYSNCLLREVATWNAEYNGRTVISKAKQCDKFNPQPPTAGVFQAKEWDQCMADSLRYGLGEAQGGERVRYCQYYYRDPKKWWQFWR